MARKKFNTKRKFATHTQELPGEVHYCGSPYHKRNPGDFGLTPGAAPHPDKTLCDEAGIEKKSEAQALLDDGLSRGLVSESQKGRFPKNIWAVRDGVPFEAILENQEKGEYHGYPLPESDPMRDEVLRRYEESEGQENA